MEKIKLAILGYGNLGKGIELAIKNSTDCELSGIYTRRDPQSVNSASGTRVYNINDLYNHKNQIDVLMLGLGSATDLPELAPQLAEQFCTVDSFDTHALIPQYIAKMEQAAQSGGNVCAVSIGWDPGVFSLQRALFDSITPHGKTYCFWGEGVSQGHSDAVRRIEGVKNAVQYTIPVQEIVDEVTCGSSRQLTSVQMHRRKVYVTLKDGADKSEIEHKIKTMPNYFSGYQTEVEFISDSEMQKHSKMNHGGMVINNSTTNGNTTIQQCSLKLDSNPEYTASVLVAYARAVYRLKKQGKSGVVTVFDVPVSYLSPTSRDQLIKDLL